MTASKATAASELAAMSLYDLSLALREEDADHHAIYRELRRREERERKLLKACGFVMGMAAVWQHDPTKSPNTMNVGFKELVAALAEYKEPNDAR